MKKFNQTEIRAIESMSPLIGAYVEKRIGSTDFSTWTHQQWFDFLRTVAHEFGEGMRRVTHE